MAAYSATRAKAMDHHVNIRLRPDPEFAPAQLMNALVSKVHRALVRRAKRDVGISFPACKGRELGPHLRLHGQASALGELMAEDWLAGIRDHVEVSDIALVPAGALHCTVSRVQAKSSPDRLRRRQMRRHQLTAEQAADRVPDSARETLNLPYIQLRSTSTDQSFPLFIRHGPPSDTGKIGTFNSYGLSDNATVPWF